MNLLRMATFLFLGAMLVCPLVSMAGSVELDTSSVITKVPPTYPEIAKKMNITGTVEVNITVDEQGKVTEAIAQTGPVMLRASAEAAVLKWKFKPGGGKGKVLVSFSR